MSQSLSFTDNSFDVSSDIFSDVEDIFFRPDGEKMYVLSRDGTSQSRIDQYGLSTAWDITTASHEESITSSEVSFWDDVSTGLYFRSNGSEVFTTQTSGNNVEKFPLSTDWDISSMGSRDDSFGTSGTNPRDIVFKDDGSKMFISSFSDDEIEEYSLSTDWDISTSSLENTFDFSTETTNRAGINFYNNGSDAILISDSVGYFYSLTSSWSTSSMSYDSDSDDISSVVGEEARYFHIRQDEDFLYVLSDSGTVYEFEVNPPPRVELSGTGVGSFNGTGSLSIIMVQFTGTVTLDGSGVEDAKVTAINDTTEQVTDTSLTDSSGEYSIVPEDEDTYHLIVEYEDENNDEFNAESRPYLTGDQTVDFELQSYTSPEQDSISFDFANIQELEGLGAGTGTGTASLNLTKLLSGNGASTATGTGGLFKLKTFTGSGSSAFTGSGQILITGPVRLTGTGIGTATGTGQLFKLKTFSGVGTGAGTGFADLNIAKTISGTGTGTSSGTGGLFKLKTFSGSATSTFTGSADLGVGVTAPVFTGLATYSSPMTVFLKTGDNKPDFSRNLVAGNDFLNLSNAENISFIVRDRYTEEVVFTDTNVQVQNGEEGRVRVVWNDGFTESKSLLGEFVVRYSDGRLRVPSRGFIPVEIVDNIREEEEV